MSVVIVEADLSNPDHAHDVVALTAAYALDEMGNGGPLPADVLERLIPGLRAHPTTLVLLAYVGGVAAGIATCFGTFSTFAARPVLNVHDLAVVPVHRGQGLGRALLQAVEDRARARGCARITLEVQENNRRARTLYEAMGFSQAVYGDSTGGSLFYCRDLSLGGTGT